MTLGSNIYIKSKIVFLKWYEIQNTCKKKETDNFNHNTN